jgi:hypothetical protein
MNCVRPLNLSPCTTRGLSLPLQDAEGKSLVMALISARISAALTSAYYVRASPSDVFFSRCRALFLLLWLSFGRILLDTTSSHHVRVCACLTAQFAFFSRADSGIYFLAEDVDIFNDTFSINVKAKNIQRSQAAPLSRVTSATHDPQRLFQQLQFKWKRLRCHHITKRPYWLFHDEQPATAQIITTWLREIMV